MRPKWRSDQNHRSHTSGETLADYPSEKVLITIRIVGSLVGNALL
jgi:hypothetical protein